jgi:hypothetical protein
MIKISTRLVFLFRTFVLKFPLDRRGYLQSRNEKAIWDKYKSAYPLGELYWEFLGVVCMKRYESVDTVPDSVVIESKSVIKEFDIKRCDLYRSENWGKEDGDYFLIDYGINKYVSTLYSR